jgi:hypothetical protein
MGDVAASGRTVVFVSHNMDAVLRLCTRAILLERGRVTDDGRSADVVAAYLARGGTTAAPNTWVDLGDVPHRGSGEARFERVRYSVPDSPARVPRPGGPLRVDIEITARQALTVASLAIGVRSLTGVMLLVADVIEKGEIVPLASGRNAIRFDFGALHLAAGTYAVTLWMGHALAAPIDEVAALELDVLDASSRGLGAATASLVHVPFAVTVGENPPDSP